MHRLYSKKKLKGPELKVRPNFQTPFLKNSFQSFGTYLAKSAILQDSCAFDTYLVRSLNMVGDQVTPLPDNCIIFAPSGQIDVG